MRLKKRASRSAWRNVGVPGVVFSAAQGRIALEPVVENAEDESHPDELTIVRTRVPSSSRELRGNVKGSLLLVGSPT
jgi:hypothetical protein